MTAFFTFFFFLYCHLSQSESGWIMCHKNRFIHLEHEFNSIQFISIQITLLSRRMVHLKQLRTDLNVWQWRWLNRAKYQRVSKGSVYMYVLIWVTALRVTRRSSVMDTSWMHWPLYAIWALHNEFWLCYCPHASVFELSVFSQYCLVVVHSMYVHPSGVLDWQCVAGGMYGCMCD